MLNLFKKHGTTAVLYAAAALVLLISAEYSPTAYSQKITPEIYSQLRYRYIGPPGNRASAVVGVPGDPMVYYIGASSGGIWKSTDAGVHWKPIFDGQPAQSIGALAVAPSDPNVVWAGTGEAFVRSNISIGNGVYKSTDAGKTWKHMGLDMTGKVGVAVAPSNSNVVYALMETGAPNRGVLWRSNDGGENWKLVSYNRLLNERPHYASRIMVSPADENEVYFAANSPSITYDGGITSETVRWSGDCHDMWADPLIPDRMMISDDGGVIISLNRGKTWKRITLPIAQMYHVAVDNQIPYYVYGGMQDGNGYKGPSTASRRRGWGTPPNEWQATAGGKCGFIVPDPVDHNIVWGGSYNAGFTRVDYRTGHMRSVQVWPESAYGSPAGLLKYRFNWTFPITISPHDHNKVYVGSQCVHQTTDGGRSWKVISPDLSTNDQSRMGLSGGLTKDNLGVEYGCIVFAIAESPIEEGCIWAGTNDGLVHITRNGGANWTNVTKNIPDFPPWGTVSNLEPSRYDAGTCYMTVDFHQMNNRDPFVYKTADYGKSWKSISSDIPRSVFSYAHWIHEDPVRKGMLYLGTENAIYISFNDGKNWLLLQNNLPHAPVHHMVIQEHFNDLVVGTYGRGFWIMDDITPLQQLTKEVLKSDVHLFVPRQAYRLHSVTGGARVNPQAFINYYLNTAPKGNVKITILDEEGRTVNTLRGSRKAGINRVSWNLRYEAARRAKLRTKPPGNPHVVEEKRFKTTWEREGWYPILSWGTSGGFYGALAAPGNYTVKLSVDGAELSRKLVVKKDPRSAGSEAGIRAQLNMLLELRGNINTVSDMISRIEWMRKQIYDLKDILKGGSHASVITAADELDKKLRAVEDKIFQPMTAEGDSKSFRYPNMLYCKLSVLAGDVASMVDFAPNKQQIEVHELLKKRMIIYKGKLDELIKTDVPAFNNMLKEKNLSVIIADKR